MSDIDYGFKTDDIEYDKVGLPVGTYKVMITGEEMSEKKALVVNYEIIEGEYRGRSGKVWYNTQHESPQVANIAKQQIKRIADATGKMVSNSSPLAGRVLTIMVRQQKKDPQYTEIGKYLPADYVHNDDVPFA